MGDVLVEVDGRAVGEHTVAAAVSSMIRGAKGPMVTLRFMKRMQDAREELRDRVGQMSEAQRAGVIKMLLEVGWRWAPWLVGPGSHRMHRHYACA